MSRNIKEIGKELLGKSLNSFHRKTGLTQLEKNNEMQDGILDGILSQVDDAYIEKTEQSNVIHLDGSGDGVVVVDGIEGNTLINLWEFNNLTDGYFVSNNGDTFTNFFTTNVTKIKPNQKYTFITEIVENTLVGNSLINFINDDDGQACFSDGFRVDAGKIGVFKTVLTTKSDLSNAKIVCRSFVHNSEGTNAKVKVRCILIEGEHFNKEMNYFKGLQSSFEEKVNDEGKYEIEILSNNRNLLELYDTKSVLSANGLTVKILNKNEILINGTTNTTHTWVELLYNLQSGTSPRTDKIIPLNKNFKYTLSSNIISGTVSNLNSISFSMQHKNIEVAVTCDGGNNFNTTFDGSDGAYRLWFTVLQGVTFNNCVISLQLEKGEVKTSYTANKQNKIKLLINEPLRAVHNVKDRLCVKDNKLVVERNVFGKVFDGTEDLWLSKLTDSTINVGYEISATLTEGSLTLHMCDRLPNVGHNQWDKPTIGTHCKKTSIFFNIPLNWLGGNTINDVKQYLADQYNQGTPMKIVHILNKPIYEEVLNEYGEPIILEGYESGTIYIDSTIIPTTTVRYTPKMESFKTLKEVNKNNNLTTLDINENIIPYMMDVDYMIMEKELCLLNTKNIRKMEELDMTSMQKRTQDMLERLIKGKTLTEQECKTRVTTYLNAGKITDEQAEELMLLIDEVYA